MATERTTPYRRHQTVLALSILLLPVCLAGPAAADMPIGEQAFAYHRQTVFGDTLWSISRSVMPEQGVTQAQLMVAILRRNPDAFLHNNAFYLQKGITLTLPSLAEVQAENPKQAESFYKRQERIWSDMGMTEGLPLYVLPEGAVPASPVVAVASPTAQAAPAVAETPAATPTNNPSDKTAASAAVQTVTPPSQSGLAGIGAWIAGATALLVLLLAAWRRQGNKAESHSQSAPAVAVAAGVMPTVSKDRELSDDALKQALAEAYREVQRPEEARRVQETVQRKNA